MCCFSRPVRHVANTRIFARLTHGTAQVLAYSMEYAAQQDLAMILPLPVALPSGQNSIRFLNLIGYSRFFDDLDSGFPQPAMPAAAGGAPAAPDTSRGFLPVQEVGDFVATFVPTLADFRRVNPQFKLSLQVWDQIPIYQDYGFAVFQLRARRNPTKVHPMALVFRTRMPNALFMPTVHIHDGQVHPTETFDHSLYVQDSRLRPTDQRNSFGDPANVPTKDILIASRSVVKGFVDIRRTQGDSLAERDRLEARPARDAAEPGYDHFVRNGVAPARSVECCIIRVPRRFAVCCFSGPVRRVANTRIFARQSGTGAQFLVYSMEYAAQQDLAMILPLPVALPASQESVQFLNLQGYPTFFRDLESGFQPPPTASAPSRTVKSASKASTLPVHEVGDFVATFVPGVRDFGRVDPQFTLPQRIWDRIPLYRDYSFAIFQLRTQEAPTRVHPMALLFKTRMPKALFLPTVHIHDGQVHSREVFDHSLYVQDYRLQPTARRNWLGFVMGASMREALKPSHSPVKHFMDVERAQRIVEPDKVAFKRELRGKLPNQDTIIPCG